MNVTLSHPDSVQPEKRPGSLGLACGVAGGFVLLVFLIGSACLRIVSTDPSDGAALGGDANCTIHFFGLPLHAAVSLDGHPLETQLDLTRWTVTARLAHLPEGQHRLKVQLDSALFKDERIANFVVDTTPPRLSQLKPRSGGVTQEAVTNIAGLTEPEAKVSVEDAQGRSLDLVEADSKGAFVARVPLADGANKLTLSAKDRAGNRFRTTWEIFADRHAPMVSLGIPRRSGAGAPECHDGQTLRVDSLSVGVVAGDDDRVARCRWSLDESTSRKLNLVRKGQHWLGQVALKDMPEGDRCLNVTVTDRSGRVTQRSWRFNVDSTEEFGHKTMTLGAKGKDVEALQKRLIEAGAWSGPVPPARGTEGGALGFGVFDEETEEAVREFKSQQGIEPVDGVAGPAVLNALGPRIFVNLSRLELVLDRPGKEPRRYRIACGMDGHGTPTGKFVIAYKEANPPWMPPPSPWAKGAKVIPPGPGNPLGTRWLGLDHGGVGIHGTNAPWSIGSRSSHGCIRMTIPDIESLFAIVEPGTPVLILASEKSDSTAEKLWP